MSQPVSAATKLRARPIQPEELDVAEVLRAFEKNLTNNSATKKVSSFTKDDTPTNNFQQQTFTKEDEMTNNFQQQMVSQDKQRET